MSIINHPYLGDAFGDRGVSLTVVMLLAAAILVTAFGACCAVLFFRRRRLCRRQTDSVAMTAVQQGNRSVTAMATIRGRSEVVASATAATAAGAAADDSTSEEEDVRRQVTQEEKKARDNRQKDEEKRVKDLGKWQKREEKEARKAAKTAGDAGDWGRLMPEIPYNLLPAKVRVKRDWLLTVPIFDGMEAGKIISRLADMLQTQKLSPPAVIVSKGDVGDEMYFIAKGEAEISLSLDEPGFVTLGPGKFFGEAALLNSEPRNAYVWAISEMKLYVLTKVNLETVFYEFPGLEEILRSPHDERKKARLKQLAQLKQLVGSSNLVAAAEAAIGEDGSHMQGRRLGAGFAVRPGSVAPLLGPADRAERAGMRPVEPPRRRSPARARLPAGATAPAAVIPPALRKTAAPAEQGVQSCCGNRRTFVPPARQSHLGGLTLGQLRRSHQAQQPARGAQQSPDPPGPAESELLSHGHGHGHGHGEWRCQDDEGLAQDSPEGGSGWSSEDRRSSDGDGEGNLLPRTRSMASLPPRASVASPSEIGDPEMFQ
jgi:CRP-like cAMP-binding protein